MGTNGNGKSSNGNGPNEKKKFLFVSDIACIGDLAYTVKQEGHKVKYFIRDKDEKDVSDGFLEKVDEWEAHKDWADIIIFDDITFGSTCEKLRKEGKIVLGGTQYTDKLELDRDFAQNEMKDAGLAVLPSWDFNSFDEAIEFVKKNPGRYVIKPNGKAQNDKVLSFVGQEEDGLDLLTILEHYKRSWSTKIKSFQIQQFAQGVEVAIGAFFNGKDFIMPACINFEHKKMFNEEIGPTTGEMGTSMFWAGPNKIFQKTLELMKEKLTKTGYTGYFDINCIANARNIYPLECTPRFGYPTISIQIEGVTSAWGELMYALATGKDFNLKTQKGFQIGVVIAVPPYPFEDMKAFEKYSDDAVVIFKKNMNSGIHHADIKIVEDDWRLTGCSGYALVVSGSGYTMDDARRETYNRIKNIIIPNMFYRTDIGERWKNDSDLLQTWGYLT